MSMVNTIETKFSLDNNKYIMKPAAPAVPKNSAPEQKPSNTKNILLASLGGLAVLGGVAVWIKTRNPKAITENSAVDNIAEKIGLKNTIRQEYLARREEVLAGMPSPEQIKELRRQISTAEAVNEPQKTKLRAHRDKNIAILREKITNLQNDEQWIELRKLRKNLINIYHGKSGKNEKIVAREKISLINDLLLTKVYPDQGEVFRDLYYIEPQDAYKLVTTKFNSPEEYRKAFENTQIKGLEADIPISDRGFHHTRTLRLADVFPDEIGVYTACNSKIKKLDNELNTMRATVQNYMQKLTELASEFQKSDNVKNLHCL